MTRLLAALGGVALLLIGALWAWLGREPRDRGAFVSESWLGEHVRGRRE